MPTVFEIHTGLLTPGASAVHTFATPVNLIAGAGISVTAVASAQFDELTSNDTMTAAIQIFAVAPLPSSSGASSCGPDSVMLYWFRRFNTIMV
jgi:hypothetical protein